MFPLDCEGIGEHCSESCHTEFGRIRAVGFIDPCYDLDINSQESWDEGVAGGFITIVPQTNGELTIDQLQGDGYGKRPQTNTIKEYTLTYNDPTFIGNYNFYDGASGQYKYKIFFRTSDAIYFSDTAVLITPNFSIQNDLGQRIDWTVTLTWRSKFFPIINTALNSEYLFACTACTPQICFFIQSVTGNLVDNTDPCNPVVDAAVSSDAGNGLTLGTDGLPYFAGGGGSGTVTSVSATVPSPTNPAFSVNVPNPTTTPSIDITANGLVSQYVRGDGSLANFPASSGGGASVNYYLNGSVNQGTFGGNTYYEMSKVPIIGGGTNIQRTNAQGNGYIAQFITDAGDPNLLTIPGGNWNFETYFSASSSGGTPSFYIELYKYDGTTFTLIASNSTNPEGITGGTVTDLYVSALAVPTTTLLATDRLAVRIYVVTSGRTITLHTENNSLCQVITTFTTGLTALNGLTDQVQNFATGTSGTDFGISSSGSTHTFNLPTASAVNRGALSSSDWSTFNSKVGTSRTISTSSPLSGGGDLSANRTISIADAVADGTTKGAATFSANDFDDNGSGLISIDYTNGQSASASTKGFLSAADWGIFNAKQDNIIRIRKAGANQTTTATTAQNITELVTADLEANKIYFVSGLIRMGCNNTGGVLFGITVPTGATAVLATASVGTGGTNFQYSEANQTTLSNPAIIRLNSNYQVYFYGRVSMGATTGNVQITFASAVAGQTSTIFGSSGSMLTFIKLN